MYLSPETRRSLLSRRIRRLTHEMSHPRKLLSPFAETPLAHTSTQLQMRPTHLENTLNAARNRIDVEEHSECNRVEGDTHIFGLGRACLFCLISQAEDHVVTSEPARVGFSRGNGAPMS